MKMIALTDFLTTAEILRCSQLKTAKPICDEIIKPNLERINAKLGQENDPMFLAYACEYVVREASK